jgi:hypothetical protein
MLGKNLKINGPLLDVLKDGMSIRDITAEQLADIHEYGGLTAKAFIMVENEMLRRLTAHGEEGGE